MKGSTDVATYSAEALAAHARLCGWSLARAHARSGSPVAISSYLGGKDVADEAMAEFARRYADQNEQDFAAHRQAIADGRIEARSDL
jgi:predicted alpha/beta hydrolase